MSRRTPVSERPLLQALWRETATSRAALTEIPTASAIISTSSWRPRRLGHTFYGDLAGRFDGAGWDFFKRGWWLWLLTLLPVAGFSGGVALSQETAAPAHLDPAQARVASLRWCESPGNAARIAALLADQAPPAIIGCPHMTRP